VEPREILTRDWRAAVARPTASAGCLRLWCESLTELNDLVQLIAEIFESRNGNNDGVTATINLLDDSQESASRVLSQVERKVFPFDSDIIVL
jgi:hypothetical protein